MHNQRIVRGATFGRVNFLCRAAVQCVSAKAIHRLCRKCHQSAFSKDAAQLVDLLLIVDFIDLYFFRHFISLLFYNI